MTEPIPSVRAVGFWAPVQRWASLHEPVGWPDPRALVHPGWERDRRAAIVRYLRKGSVVARYAGFSYCRFPGCTTPETAMGDADLSDGFACWPEGLAHYIEQHDVRLPEELVQRMEARSFAAPEPQRESLVVEHRWWLDWAAANTPAPVPAPDALSFEEAARLVERLRTPLFAPCLRVGHGRWRVGLDEARVEYLPPCSAADLRRYLLSRRRVPSDAYLSAAQANRISKEVFGSSRRRPQVSRTICLMRAPPDRWFIRSGTIQEEQPRLDELGWRFTLECFRDAQPQASALDEALRRGVAGTGCQ